MRKKNNHSRWKALQRKYLLMHTLAKRTERYDKKDCDGFNHHEDIFWYVGIDGQPAVFE